MIEGGRKMYQARRELFVSLLRWAGILGSDNAKDFFGLNKPSEKNNQVKGIDSMNGKNQMKNSQRI